MLDDHNGNLVNSILDAFTSLFINSEVMTELQQTILKRCPTMPLESLSVYVQFILASIEPGDEVEVIRDLRDHLNFESSQMVSQLTQNQTTTAMNNTKSKDNGVSVALHYIELSISTSKVMGNAWIRAIEEVKLANDHKPLDLMVLLILHSLPNRTKSVESLIRNKLRAGLFTEELIVKTLK